jgi:predicted DsbA family dithiol-disulfide isomerase
VLLDLASARGLDTTEAAEVIRSGAYAAEVREAEQFWQQAGIHSVPAVVINDRT